MLVQCYLRRGVVYLPTVGEFTKGGYVDIDPVEVALVSDTEALRRGFHEVMARGNPSVPSRRGSEWPKPVVLKHAKVKSWPAFERGLSNWTIKEDAGIYRICRKRKQPNRTWVDDPNKTIVLPPGSTGEGVIERMIAILQAAAMPLSK